MGSELFEEMEHEERLSDFMGDLFQELLSKEMFYEPMKELNEKVSSLDVEIIMRTSNSIETNLI